MSYREVSEIRATACGSTGTTLIEMDDGIGAAGCDIYRPVKDRHDIRSS